jgi:hypothetical protein
VIDLISEITLYVPNLSGQLNKSLEALSEANVNLLALCVEQTGAYSTLRIIPDDLEKAKKQLKKHAFGFSTTEVFAIAVPHEAGGLQDFTELLANSGVNIEYAYVAMPRKIGEAIILVKTNKEEKVKEILLTRKDIHDLDKIVKS